MSKEVKIKISQPMFVDGELERFDNNIHSIIEEYSKMMFKEKDQILTQRIIIKQEQEIDNLKSQLQEKENIIKEVREYIRYCIRIIHNERTGTFENDLYMKEQDLKEFLQILDKDDINI